MFTQYGPNGKRLGGWGGGGLITVGWQGFTATTRWRSLERPITLTWVAALAWSVRYWRSGTGTSPEPCHPPIPRCALSAARWTKHKGECPAIRRDGMPKGHDLLWSIDIQLQCDAASHQQMLCSTLYHTFMHWLMERVGTRHQSSSPSSGPSKLNNPTSADHSLPQTWSKILLRNTASSAQSSIKLCI